MESKTPPSGDDERLSTRAAETTAFRKSGEAILWSASFGGISPAGLNPIEEIEQFNAERHDVPFPDRLISLTVDAHTQVELFRSRFRAVVRLDFSEESSTPRLPSAERIVRAHLGGRMPRVDITDQYVKAVFSVTSVDRPTWDMIEAFGRSLREFFNDEGTLAGPIVREMSYAHYLEDIPEEYRHPNDYL